MSACYIMQVQTCCTVLAYVVGTAASPVTPVCKRITSDFLCVNNRTSQITVCKSNNRKTDEEKKKEELFPNVDYRLNL